MDAQEYFWKIVEKDFYCIPNFIKNAFNENGYSNPLSMKNVNDERLAKIEKYVRDNGSDIIEQKTKNQNGLAVSKNQMLVDIYGETFYSAPEKFHFRDGDKMLIKELVEHVKQIVDGDGVNSGLHAFKMKLKKPRNYRLPKTAPKKTQPLDHKSKSENNDMEKNTNLTEMRSDLLHKVETCLANHGAIELAGIGRLDEEIVNVTIENGRNYGNITCVLCRDKKSKGKKLRISYCSLKNNWIMSNYVKHLVDRHQLKLNRNGTKRNDTNRMKNEVINVVGESTSPIDVGSDMIDDGAIEGKLDKSDDVYVVEEVEVEITQPNANIQTEPNVNNKEKSLYHQLAQQIGHMIGAILINDDQQEQMRFFHCNTADELTAAKALGDGAELTVAKISGDGNCLLYSIIHQLFRMPIDSEEHKAAMHKLRADIVEYILRPENFDSFKYTLQNRVYDIKNKSDIVDMAEECKNYVRNVLSMDGYWGGYECIIAASRIYSVNIITFEEDGKYYFDDAIIYDRTIAIAYRCVKINDDIIYNHYDSVCDISSTNLYKAASMLEDRINKKK